MSNDNEFEADVDIHEWVDRAKADPQRYMERQATEVLLTAVGQSPAYGERLYLKGGILMGVVYQSPRQTADIDYTAAFQPGENIEDELREALNPELQRAAARQGYPQLVCRVQRIKRRPRPERFVDAKFPALDMTIGYAERGTPAYERLENGQSPHTLKMEISFHEPVHAIKFVHLSPGAHAAVGTYSLADVIAEKLRALLQQTARNRYRRQDAYDIDFLVRKVPLSADDKKQVLDALLIKARARDIEPHIDSMSDPEVRRRAQDDWGTLAIELDELPAFDDAFSTVEEFYRSLPW